MADLSFSSRINRKSPVETSASAAPPLRSEGDQHADHDDQELRTEPANTVNNPGRGFVHIAGHQIVDRVVIR